MKPLKIIKVLLIVLLCIGALGVGVQQLDYHLSAKANERAQALVKLPTLETDGKPSETAPPETSAPETEASETEAPETEAPETEAPETEAPETEAPETEAPETEAPETEAPETEAPETDAPETDAPETEIPETETPEEPVEPDAYAEQLLLTDLTELKKINDDIFGWIVIPGTTISYPLLQGEDNTHYLYYSYEGWWSWAGSIFLDYRSSQSMTDFHSIIYGHRMYNDSMFNGLKNYADEAFAAAYPSVYILTDDGVRRYDVFAAYEADAQNGHSYRLGLEGAEDRQKLINYALRNSVISVEREVSAADGDRMLTLSTCTAVGTAEARWVVHFVLAYELLTDGE